MKNRIVKILSTCHLHCYEMVMVEYYETVFCHEIRKCQMERREAEYDGNEAVGVLLCDC